MAETFNIMIAHYVRSGRSRSGLNIKKLTYIFCGSLGIKTIFIQSLYTV